MEKKFEKATLTYQSEDGRELTAAGISGTLFPDGSEGFKFMAAKAREKRQKRRSEDFHGGNIISVNILGDAEYHFFGTLPLNTSAEVIKAQLQEDVTNIYMKARERSN